jgi:hypothetical protein
MALLPPWPSSIIMLQQPRCGLLIIYNPSGCCMCHTAYVTPPPHPPSLSRHLFTRRATPCRCSQRPISWRTSTGCHWSHTAHTPLARHTSHVTHHTSHITHHTHATIEHVTYLGESNNAPSPPTHPPQPSSSSLSESMSCALQYSDKNTHRA